MEEQAARWGGLGVCHVLTQEGRPRPRQMGRAHLAAGLGFLGQRGCHQPSPAATNSAGKPSSLWGDPGIAVSLSNLSCALQLGCSL